LDRLPSAARAGWREPVLWVALCAALSPSLVDLARHWVEQPWALPSAIFAPLWLLVTLRDRSPRRPHADGYLLLALGLAVALGCAGGGMVRLGRPGIPLAILGLSRVLGRPTPARALVAAWMVPVPDALLNALSPGLESAIAAAAVALARGFGVDASFTDGLLAGPAGALALGPADGGIPLAALLGGLGWYRAASSGASIGAAAVAALRSAPWALPVQIVALCLACGLALAGASGLAGDLLHYGVWIAAMAAAWLGGRRRSARPERMRLGPGARWRRAR
jgi:hypothetical protein